MENAAERQSHFGIRKLTIGAASVLLGTTLWMSNENVVQASDNGNDGNNGNHAADDSKTEMPKITDDTKVVIEKSDDAAKAAQAQSQNQTNDNAQSQEAPADQNKVESSAVEKAQTESAQADTSVQQTEQNTEKSAKSDKNQTTKDQVAENAKKAFEVQKQKAENVTNSNSKTETTNKESSAESAKQSSTQEATKAAESAESNVTKAIDNSNATLATTNEVAAASQTLKTAGIQGNTNQKDNKSNDNTVSVDLSKLGVTGTTDKGIQKTSLAVNRLLSANTQNLESNEVNVQQFSSQTLAQLFGASFVQTTSGSGSSDATDIANTTIDFNFTDPSGYNTTVTGIPADKYGYVADYDTSRKITYVLATDRSNPGQTLYLYANGQLVASSSQSTTPSKPTLGGKLTIDQTNGNTYQGGTYNYVKTITSSLPGTGLNTFTRIDVTDGDGKSPVTNGASGSADQSARTLQMIWNNGGKTVESSNWQSIGGLVPIKVKQNVWYVDADTGELLAHKVSADTISGQEYNLNGAQYDKITANGKTYDLVKRNNGVYDASQLATDRTLTTNNGVAIKASDLLDTPLTGQIKNYRAGDINFTVTNTGPNRLYVTQQLDTKGTVTLNAYDAERYNGTDWKAMYVSDMARPTLRSGGIADGAKSEFVNNATNGNQDVIILYKAATPVVNKQKASITFVNDDNNGASLSPQQNASGDAGSQISFDNAGTTVANLISQGYVYNGTTGDVTNGAASGSFTSVGFPVYDNDDNTNQAFVVHFKNPVQTPTYHQGVEESKTIHRTINYYDKVTREKIPSNLISQNPVTDSVTFTRTQILDQDGKFVGYGTISADGKSILKRQDWHTADGESSTQFNAKPSSDLSAFNYTAPEFQNGDNASIVAAHDVTPDTQDLVYNVYYGHQTKQVTTNEDVTRRFHYIFTDGTTPESHLTPQADQKVSFTGTATKDLVTGTTGPTTWSPSTGTLAHVAGQTVAGYHITGYVNANADGSADAVTVNPDSGDIDVTIVYTPDAKTPDTPQKAKVTIYDKTENNKQLSNFENNNGTKGSAISFDGEPQTLQAYLNSGYVFDSATDANGNSIGTASNINFGNFDSINGNVQSFNIYLVHGTDTKTEKATTNAHVHYVVAGNEANKPAAPADSPTQTINWTRTNTTDKVTGTTTEGTWTPDKNSFTSVTSPELTGYTPDQAVANFTTPQPNRDQVITVVYNPNPQVDQKADLVIYDKTDNNKELNNFNNSGKTGTPISFSGSANYVADLIAKGYKIDSFVNDQNQTSNPTSYDQINFSNFDNDSNSDQHFKLYLVHDTENVTDKKTTTSTVHYVVSDGKTTPPTDNVQTITWTRPGTKDKVTGVTTPTGNWTTPDHYNDVPTPNLDGYTPDKTNVPGPIPDPNQNPTTVVTYNPKTPEAPTYTGTTETKTVTRTINYYDKVTGEKIPNELIKENPTTQNVTLSRTHVVSSTGQDMGYGSVTDDGKTFTKAPTADGWNTGDWAQVTSPDLSNSGYTAPDLAQADHVTVDANTKDAVVNVYYGHQTEVITPNNPHNPGRNVNPNDPRNKPSVYPDGLTKEALTTEVTRHINYVGVNEDGTTTPVNGSPDGKNTYTQTVSFERNAVIDKVTGQILGYSTDGTTNVTTTDKDRAWTPTTQNMSSVDSKTPSEVGYDKVDISTVGGVTVYPGQKVNDVTVTYTKNKSPEVTQKATLEIIDNNDANAPKQLASFSNEGKSEDQITFANSNEILQSYLSQGYKVQKTAGNLSGDAQSGYTYPTYGNTTQDFKIYLIHDTEDKTETAQATAQVHYVVADNGVQAPKDSDLQTITYTKTNKVDKVTGAVVNEGEWKADKSAFTDVTSPDLSKDGYTPSLENVQFNAPERNVNQRVTVVYNRSAQAADLQIIDDNDPQNQRVLATYSAGGESGKQISFDGSNTQLQNYLKNGYTFEKSEGQGMSGDAANGFTYPSFDNNSKTNQSFKIYLKHATGEKKETATTTAHVHYIMADGTKAPDDSATQTINWSRTNTVDQVTGAVVKEGTWSSDKNAFTDVDSPTVIGYTPGTKTVKFATPERGADQVVNVVYTKDAPTPDKQNALVVYQDVNDPAHPIDLGHSDQLTGEAGDSINYSTANKIAEYEKQGYVLVSNGFDANGTKPSFDNINGNTQTFYVTFKHGIQPVTPTTPGTPDQPINPDNPDGPKYPSGTDKTSLTKNVTRTVTYEGAGDKTPSPVTDTLHFQGTGYLDKITGKWTDADGKELSDQTKGITWTITDGTKDEGSFNLVPTKHIDGYTSKVVTDGADDGNGNVKSYTGITHTSDNINVVVQYNPIVAEQGNLIVKFHDDTDNKDLPGVGTDTGTQDVGTQVTYNPSTDLTNLENKGYVYVSTDGNIPPSIVKGTTTVTIHVKHGTVPVTPDNPGTPDKPINPNDPDGPKYPSGTDKASIDKTITRTVHYEGADQYTPNDVQQPVHFTAKGELDRVTGEWTKELTWSGDQTFNSVTTPKIPGYHVVSVDKDTTDNQNVDSAKISHTGSDYTVTVKYAKDAAPTPDTTTGKVTYIDDTAQTTLKTDSLSGNVGANIDYTTQDKINNYINMGYKLVSNNFTDGKEVFNKDASKNDFEVHLVHDTVPVTPDNPGTPDKPINPNDPRPKDEQPKYPTGTSEIDLTKDITRTVHYEGADQYTPNDVQQPVHFTAKGVLDKVTGEWTKELTWSGDQTFNSVTTPKIPGYHVVSVDKDTTDHQNVDSAKISHTGADYTVTVKYTKNDVPTPIKQGTIEVVYHDTTDNVDIPGYGRTQTKEDEGTSYSYNPNDKDLPALENKGYVLDGELPTIPTKYTDGDQRIVINVKHGTRPVTPEKPANPTDPVDPQHPGTPTPSNPNLSKTDLEKSITRTVKYQYANGAKANDDSVQTVSFKGQGTIDLVTGNLVNVDKDGNIVDQRGKITWDHDSQEFGNVDAINHDGYYVSNVSETNTSAQVTDTAVAKETITPSSQNSTIVITLTKNPEAPKTQQNAQLTIRDVTPGQEQDLGSYTQPGLEGDAISFGNAQEFIQNLLNKGYVWDGASYNGTNLDATNYAGIKFGNYDNTDDKNDISQKWVINLVHGVTPVNPDHPDDKDGYTKKYLDRTITRDVTYVDEKGNEMPGLTPEHQEAKFQGSGYLDNVTGKWVTVENGKITGLAQGLTWTPDKDANFDAIAAKTAEGYHVVSVSGNGISGFTVSQDGAVTAQTVSKDTPSSTIKVVYAKTPVTPVPANGSIVYIDDTTGTTLENANFGGNVGDKINYTTADRIANYEKKGYNVVSNNFHDGQETFTNGENKFEVHLVHATTPITPENPGKPGQEVPNPNDPNNPHTIPDNFVPQTLTKTVTRDVTYVYEDGSQAETPVHQTFTFNGNGIVDLVTGQLVTVENGKITGAGKITWNADNHDFDATKAIDTTQYNIVKVSENNTSANVDMSNGVVASETINPNSQNSKVVITLAKKPVTPTPVEKGTVIVNYVDKTTGNTLETATSTGNEGSNVNYSTKDTITKYTNRGYKLSHDGYPTGNVTYTNGTQTYTVELVHDTVPVTPTDPGKPGQPINPNDPNGPKYPDGTGRTDLTKTVTRTINYVGDGLNIPASHTEIEFTGSGVLDKVTGQWTTPLTWTVKGGDSDSGNFEQVDGPKADGYYITNISSSNEDLGDIDSTTGTVASKTINHANGNIVITINYAKKTTPTPPDQTVVGKQVVHYVDEQGNKLRDDNTNETFVFTKPGKTGQWNETSHKYADANAVVIDGYVSDQKTYEGQTATPEDANKEITIVYHKIGKIIPVDPSGNPIPDAPTPGYHNDPNDPSKVTPNEPTPNVPGWTTDVPNVTPEVPTKDTNVPYTKNTPTPAQGSVTIVVHDKTTNTDLTDYGYTTGTVDEGSKVVYDHDKTVTDLTNKGYKLVQDIAVPSTVDGSNKTLTMIVEHDTVTITPDKPGTPGQPINPNDPNGPKWNNGTDAKSLTKTGTQTVHYQGAGNQTPQDNVSTVKFEHSITYDRVTGKVVKDNGWTSSQTYETVATPTVDGYTPDQTNVGGETVSVDQNGNGDIDKSYVVTYTKNQVPTPTPTPTPEPQPTPQTVNGKQTITFVDGDNGNTPLRDPDVQAHKFTNGESSYTFGTINVPVIDGYVAEVKTAGGKTVTPANPDANVTVVYHKIGKIVPVDPDHNPIPGADQPSYHNDPTDPTKVVPDEPVPTIDGYTPDQDFVTPVDPTKDTEVVYRKHETPKKPETPKTPEEPTIPEEPKKPATPKKENNKPKPTTPKPTPNYNNNIAPHSQNGYWNNNIAPHATSVNGWTNNIGPHGETVDANGNIVAPNGEIIGYVDANGNPHYTKSGEKNKTLPQTGEKTNEAAALLGGLSAGLGLIGLAGVKKRRRKED
ncbi:LPXTG-motif cell wall anchor domain protein [Lactobacillus intestinalis DSM 6629]|uniref:LPXTG-motif cell wall anchor domain protein n=2 Tax=Lactobacillus intestinalis TaxID=151781 RepID=A0ABR5PQ76_9LACO|nr:LPXTG-motif cell wall anchor domain protein [Lactobacillus intestinalis DSM 6629]